MKTVTTKYDVTSEEVESAVRKLFFEKYPELAEEEREDNIVFIDEYNSREINTRPRVGVTAYLVVTKEYK